MRLAPTQEHCTVYPTDTDTDTDIVGMHKQTCTVCNAHNYNIMQIPH